MGDLEYRNFDILVVDDEKDNLDAFRMSFRRSFTLHFAVGGQVALEMLHTLDPAVIVSDQRMPSMNGIEFLKCAKAMRPDAIGILLTAYADLSVLIDAINSGAVERYIQKPWDSHEMAAVLRQSIGRFATIRENQRLKEQIAHYARYLERESLDPLDYGELEIPSAYSTELRNEIEAIAKSDQNVLIVGESGTERPIVARSIHVLSNRESKPFIHISGNQYPGNLLDAELLGTSHTDSHNVYEDRIGKLALAHLGTLYLEDPQELSKSIQETLKNVFNRNMAAPNTRMIIGITPATEALLHSTNHPLVKSVSTRLEIKPLRSRPQDIEPFAIYFLSREDSHRKLSSAALDKLRSYPWPGNIRELEHTIVRSCLVSQSDMIEENDLCFSPFEPSAHSVPSDSRKNLNVQLDNIERHELLAALKKYRGNKAEVARSLGIQRTTLYYRLKRLNIEP